MNEALKIYFPDINFKSDDYGWRGCIPKEKGNLFGINVSLKIDTRLIPTIPKELPEVQSHQASVAALIVENLSIICSKVEEVMEVDNLDHEPEYKDQINSPEIWIALEDDDETCEPQIKETEEWTFIIRRKDNPDFGYHLEFDGLQFIESWSGD